MSEGEERGVDAAFEALLTELDAEIELVNRAGASAFQSRDCETVAEAGASRQAAVGTR